MSRKFSYIAFLISLLIHGAIWFAYDYAKKEQKKEVTYVPVFTSQILTPQELENLIRARREVVKNDAPESTSDKSTKDAKYLSERTTRVDKETIARGQGGAVPIVGDGREKSSEKLRRLGMRAQVTMQKTEGDGGVSKVLNSPGTGIVQSASSSGLAPGSTDLVRDDIAIGSQTLLNADEYRFASFFNRLKSEIVPRWVPRVHQILRSSWQQLPEGNYLSEVSIGTDEQGKITMVEVQKSSGYRSFDQAAIDAFWELSMLRNLPHELLSRDNRYRTSFTFVVQHTKKGIRFDTISENEEKR